MERDTRAAPSTGNSFYPAGPESFSLGAPAITAPFKISADRSAAQEFNQRQFRPENLHDP